jgi:Leucine-rich repeat (LRR) protein
MIDVERNTMSEHDEFFNCAQMIQIPATECNALMTLAGSLKGHPWNVKKNPGRWKGIRCVGGHVVSICLPNHQLTGTIPDLTALSQLERLQLHQNQLSGTVESLSGLNHLKVLTLHKNQLTGPLLDLTGFSRLKVLALNHNQLTGRIGPLNSLVNLERLFLDNNQLFGTIPDLTALSQLKIISVSFNQLNGPIPSLTRLIHLETLDLSHNQLTDSIPPLKTLTGLKRLYLNHNQLTGQIPDLKTLNCLEQLDLNNNQLSGTIESLNSLTRLQHLDFSHNRLSGPIPSINELKQLERLYLNNNELTGSLPNFALTKNRERLKLKWVSLDNNQLKGTIGDLTVLPRLRYLSLHNNQLCGNFPNFSNNLSNADEHLYFISLHNNQLSGLIPSSIKTLSHLKHLSIDNNHLTTDDAAVIEFLDRLNPNWEKTQTYLKTIISQDGIRYQTGRGDKVHSESEIIIADLLYQKGIHYKYEMPLIANGQIHYPSFTFIERQLGLIFYWEHFRQNLSPSAKAQWRNKINWYRQQQILPYEQGGGKKGILIVTQEDRWGRVEPLKIEQRIDDIIVSLQQIKENVAEKKYNLFTLLQTALLLHKRK